MEPLKRGKRRWRSATEHQTDLSTNFHDPNAQTCSGKCSSFFEKQHKAVKSIFGILNRTFLQGLIGSLLVFTLCKACFSHGGLFILKMQDKGLTKSEMASGALTLMPINMVKTLLVRI